MCRILEIRMFCDDLVRTIPDNYSDEEDQREVEEYSSESEQDSADEQKSNIFAGLVEETNEDAEFPEAKSALRSIAQLLKEQEKPSNKVPVDVRIKEKLKEMQDNGEIESEDDEENSEAEDDLGVEEETSHAQDLSKAKKFQDKVPLKSNVVVESFDELNISKPLLKAIKEMNFKAPTPVQARAIPLALKGKDILVNAVTGSGKTAAFVLPILERLLFMPKGITGTRAVFLCPTRELAAQCYEVVRKLCRFCQHITAALIVGGLSEKSQAIALRANPHIVIATPGRLLDHLLNSKSVGFETLEVLVLDEADRLLEMGFVEEVDQIVRMCPKGRQTMMFSATLTDQVNELAQLALKKPERIIVDPLFSLAGKLTQEFIRVRKQHDSESNRLSIILALAMRTFKSKTIIFFPSKVLAHRARIIFGLANLNATELHGNLAQSQRLEALELFREAKVDFLLCTDLAARGLDISGVETVINYSLPVQLAQYVHRVGRTARAGRNGHAVCLIGDADHKMLAEILKRAPHQVKKRIIPQEIIASMTTKIEGFQNAIDHILADERIEKDARIAEMEANKTENMMRFEQEIIARPPKTWFKTEEEKRLLKQKTKEMLSSESKEEVPQKPLSAFEKKKQKKIEAKIAEIEKEKEEKKKILSQQRKEAKLAKSKFEEDRKRKIEDEGTVRGVRTRYASDYDPDAFDVRAARAAKEQLRKKRQRGLQDSDDEDHDDRQSKQKPAAKQYKQKSGSFKSKKRYKRH
jgi:ATP-dependent RNA helicase DDX27